MIKIKHTLAFALSIALTGCLSSSSDDKDAVLEQAIPPNPVENSLFGSNVFQLQQAYENEGVISSAYDKSIMRLGSQVMLTVTATTESVGAVKQNLEALGMTQATSYKHLISGLFPIEKLNSIENISGVQWVNSHRATANSVGIALNNGEPAMFADVVKRQENLDGSGVTIGVMSDSYNCLGGAEADIFSGDLPTNVEIIKEYAFCNGEDNHLRGSDEGRAMMQIIHDITPKAKLLFYTAFESPVAFAEGIGKLADAGADIIVDDIGWFAMPMFQEGPIAQAVNEVKARGVTYFSAAGNSARQSYEHSSQFETIINSSDMAHNFGLASGQNSDFYQKIIIPADETITISFQWASPYQIANAEQGASSDLDIFLFNATKNEVVAQSTDNNIGHNPVELLGYNNNTEQETFYLYVRHIVGDKPNKLKYIIFNNGSSSISLAKPLSLVHRNGNYVFLDEDINEMANGEAVIIYETEDGEFSLEEIDIEAINPPDDLGDEDRENDLYIIQFPDSSIDLRPQGTLWFVPEGFDAILSADNEQVLILDNSESTKDFIAEYKTNSSTTFGHSNASGAISVGAMSYKQTPWFNGDSTIENFSSAGGTPILYGAEGALLSEPEYHLSPAIVAVDDIDTTFFGSDSNENGLPNFTGTSAAAPNAAAVAALLLQKNPFLSPDNVKQAMMQGTIDLTDPSNVNSENTPEVNPCASNVVFDWGTGCGLLQANLMFEAVVSLPIDTSFGDFNGNACIDTEDQAQLTSALRFNSTDRQFDLNNDEQLNETDLAIMDNLLLSTAACQ